MRINRDDCCGLVIDLQERLFPHMLEKENLSRRSLILIEGLQVLGVPVMITEQYPKGLGLTIASVQNIMDPYLPIEKISFSCCDEPDFRRALEKQGKKWVIICGIEAHVCVLQTVIDLLESGFEPVVVTDCISSRNREDKEVALDRMRKEGVYLSSSESILFELIREAGTEDFKAISRLVK